MANRIVYAICSDDCKFETMTKEDILAAIQQAIEQGYVSEPGEAVFSKIKEINANGTAQIWVGTEAEFNALNIAQNIHKSVVRVGTDGVLYLCTDDTSINDVTPIEGGGTGATSAAKARETLGVTPANIGAAKAGHGHKVTEIEGAFPAADYDGLIVKRGSPVQAELKGGRGITAVTTLEPKQEGSGDPSPENIRPFIGYDAVELNHAGKNLLPFPPDSATMSGITFAVNDDGSVHVSGTATALVTWGWYEWNDLLMRANTEYVLSGSPVGAPSEAYVAIVNGAASRQGAETKFSYAKDTLVNVRIVVNSGVTIDAVFRPMIRLAADADSTFATPQHKLHTVQIGQTVYGGKMDWLTGKFISGFSLLDMATLSWNYDSANGYWIAPFQKDAAQVKDNNQAAEWLCDHYKVVARNSLKNYAVVLNVLGNVMCMNGSSTKKPEGMIVYKLATPIEIQLDGVGVIEALEGVNTIYGDGDLEVTFNHDNAVMTHTHPDLAAIDHTHPDFIYSAEETDTGKVWIDGKPIYRQIFTVHESFGSSDGIGSSELGTISNLDVPINVYGAFGYVFGDSIYSWMAVGMRVSAADLWTGIEISGSGLVRAYSSNSSVDAGYVAVEYTKKTE